MSASNLAILKSPSTKPAELPAAASGPTLCCKPLLRAELPRRFIRVPTYAVGVHPEHREYPRATLNLPLKLSSVAGVAENFPITLVTRDISSTGVYFLCPRELPANAAMVSLARVRRVQPAATPGWFGIAASFDDVQFDRDDCVPSRFHGV
jgi:hypothetical protein